MTNTNSVTHSSTTEFAPTRYYDSLDSLRGIAAILVFFYHISFKTFLSHIALIEKGYLMVDFFFILSGFVITHSYEHRLKNFHEAKFFILKRFSRLYPLHLLMLLLYLGLEFFKYFYEIRTGITSNVPAFTQSNTLTFVSNLFLTHALGLHSHLSYNFPSWSISAEFYTYILFSVWILLLKNITPLGRSLIAFIISLTSYSYLARNFPDLDITFDYGFIRCVAGFYLGYLTYRLQHTSKRFYEHSSMGWIAILIALVFPLCMNKITVDKFDFVFPLLSFFLIFFVSMSARNSLIQKILGHGSLLWLGKRSYSLYMLSALVIWLINNTLRFLFKQPTITDIGGKTLVLLNPTVATLTLVATTALLLFFSDLAYRKIEKRFQYILNSYFFKSSPSLSD